MKLLFLIETLGRGGAEQALVNILPELKAQGIQCEVAFLRGSSELESEIRALGIRVHSLNLSHGWNLPEGLLKLRRLIKAGRFDVVHSHLFFSNLLLGLHFGGAFRRSRQSFRVKTMMTFHSLEFEREPAKTPWKRFRRRLYEKALLRLDAHTAVSRAIAEQVLRQKQLATLKVDIVHNPLSDKIFQHAGKPTGVASSFSTSTQPFKICVPARLIPEKGHVVLFSAIARLNDLSIEVNCYGKGPLDAELRSFISTHQLDRQIFIHDPLSQPQLWDKIASSDLVVLPSLSEGFGMAAAEAMALGVPVIASRIGGLSEVVTDQKEGLLFDPGDAKSLAEKITQLRNDPALCLALVTSARMKTESYRPKLIARQWKSLYEALAP
jgi:glycosyltransferase involved in cell wall biosynthesis